MVELAGIEPAFIQAMTGVYMGQCIFRAFLSRAQFRPHPRVEQRLGSAGTRGCLSRLLPGSPARYSVAEMSKGFFTVRDSAGTQIHFGRGSVAVVRPSAPF